MEIEYLLRPKDKKCQLLTAVHKNLSLLFLSQKNQKLGKEHIKTTLGKLLKSKLLGEWHAYWLAESYKWFLELGITPQNLRIRQHTKEELSHYSSATFDIDYNFPFGWKEIFGIANRGQFDLGQHEKYSGKSMHIFDEQSKEKVLPRVIEPSFGLDRTFLAVLYDAYNDNKKRGNIVLNLNPNVAFI